MKHKLGYFDKKLRRWVTWTEQVEGAEKIAAQLAICHPVIESDVDAEQADWEADEEEPQHCRACHEEPGTCGHWLGCPEC